MKNASDLVWPAVTTAPARKRGPFALRRIMDKIRVWLGWPHLVAPTTIGAGDHDCALASLYWAAPWIPEDRIVEAFGFCTENWPYGGVTNKEFQIALKYLKAETHYSTDLETLGALLDSRPARCVALLPGHFIAIVNGEIVGRDAHLRWSSSTTVYCHWTFRSRRSRLVEGWRRIS